MKPELVAKACNVIGEGPRWNAAEQRLYWVDFIEKQNIRSWHTAQWARRSHGSCHLVYRLSNMIIYIL
jgi:sugar lactone lactonase YvrE